jgi:hypothetical protein
VGKGEGEGVLCECFCVCVTLSISNCTKFICVHVFMHVTLCDFNIVGHQFKVVQWMHKKQIENCVL